jgi:hypothetical protein
MVIDVAWTRMNRGRMMLLIQTHKGWENGYYNESLNEVPDLAALHSSAIQIKDVSSEWFCTVMQASDKVKDVHQPVSD